MAERQKWFREFDKVLSRPIPHVQLQLPCIGTVLISIISGHHIPCDMESYCVLELNDQRAEMRPVRGLDPFYNQSEVLCIASFDDTLRISILNFKKYAPNELLGFKDLSLDFLEYYNERSTEPIQVELGRGQLITITLQYRSL